MPHHAIGIFPVGRGFASAVALADRLVCFGGGTGGGHPSGMDPVAGRWSEAPIADVAMRRFASIVIGSKLWTIGGEARRKAPIIQSFDLR